ncbi:MAG TPA: bifunctional hydroxymethylpyrimidine kinase/phosphomethylpyrimidine kinase, partial [Ideonella sp.]|nr:bifunctional hydroxymethylpyrimidine kinase/phosphomethylpyrimidine kinase [Ideonella sp.]
MNPNETPRPVVWSIAGSDSGAGAGLQADLRAFDAMEVLGCTAVAAITAQNSVALDRMEPVATGLLAAQLDALAGDMPPQAIKTGLLGSAENIRCVATWVDSVRRAGPVALVVDPLWRASTGADLANDALRSALLRELLPRATVITPNRAEAAWLLGWDAALLDDPRQVEQAARALRQIGPQAVVITGGDAGGELSLDWMDTPQAGGWLSLPRVRTPHHHGSGCVFAASLAAALARGFCCADATVLAKMSTAWALREAALAGSAGQGAGAARPARGFALNPEVLPSLHASAAAALAERETPAFAALTARALGLYAVVDSAAWVERVLAAGVRTVQLRI